MKNFFNLYRYIELRELRKNNEISLFDKNFIELLEYESTIKSQIAYNHKKDYLLLLSKFLDKSIAIHKFEYQLKEFHKQDIQQSKIVLENFQDLKHFYIAADLQIFSNLINKISELCFDFYESFDDLEPITKDELYKLINKYYLQLQKAFPYTVQEIVENIEQEYEKLVYRSFNFLGFILGLIIISIFYNAS